MAQEACLASSFGRRIGIVRLVIADRPQQRMRQGSAKRSGPARMVLLGWRLDAGPTYAYRPFHTFESAADWK